MSPHAILETVSEELRAGRGFALATVLARSAGSAARPGAKRVLFEDRSRPAAGSSDDPKLDAAIDGEARTILDRGVAERRTVEGVDVFLQAFVPPPVLYVIGAVFPAGALAELGRFLGYRVVVCDPRSPFATAERLPAAHEIVREWPDAYLNRVTLTPRDAVCILTHDVKFDVPAIEAALRTPVGYVGAMGSQKTHARRVERLRENGVREEQLAKIAAPIGLDIGAKTPPEVALSIAAELVAKRRFGARSRSGRGRD
jgi:xanthine dehydrogenase accessory factor